MANVTVTHGDPGERGSAVAVTDRLSRKVEFVASPKRIVSLSPAMTEIVYAVGAEDRLVGVTDYYNHPPAAALKTHVGGGVGDSLNREVLLSLKPDLVLAKWDTHEELIRQLEHWNIPVLAFGAESLQGMFDDMRAIGRVTGRDEIAEAVVNGLRHDMDALLTRARAAAGSRPSTRIFYQVWDDPLMSAGPDSFIGELLTSAGAQNILEGTAIRYPQISLETVLAADPEVIIAPSNSSAPSTVENILKRPGWQGITAVRTGRVHLIDGDRISRCGPRLVEAFEELLDILNPADGAPETAP